MEIIKERILGEKRALNAPILALNTGITVQEARHQLQKFYEANQDKVSAAFLVTEITSGKRVFRIVDAPNESAAQIYALSVSNATDPVVLAELDREKQLLAAGLSSEQLVKTGRLVNPLVQGNGPVLTGVAATGGSAPSASSEPKKESTSASTSTSSAASTSEPPQKKQQLDPAANVGGGATAPKADTSAPTAAPKAAAAPKKGPIKLAKIPPKAGPKKQASLTSFFSKKQ